MSVPAVRLDRMTLDEYDAWSAQAVQGFADSLASSGTVPPAEAATYAAEQQAALLPDGPATPNHHFWTVREADGSAALGHLWLLVRPMSSEVEAFVYDVGVAAPARGRGFGRATMLAGEQAARALGAGVMRLNVFAGNPTAVRLYESLGYRTALANLVLDLTARDGDPAGVSLRDLTDDELGALRPRWRDERVDAAVAAGLLPAEEARQRLTAELDRLLANGTASEGALLWAVDGTADTVWLQVGERSDGPHAYAQRLPDPERLLGAVVRALQDRGIRSLGAPAHGEDAMRHLEELGFARTAQTMVKRL